MNSPMKVENEEALFTIVSSLIENSRKCVAKAINSAVVSTYCEIGYYVVEYEQQGNLRASYGKQVIENLSRRLTMRFGRGWSVATLTNCRKFLYRIWKIGCSAYDFFISIIQYRMQCTRYSGIPSFVESLSGVDANQ